MSTTFSPPHSWFTLINQRWFHSGRDISDLPMWWACSNDHHYQGTLAQVTARGSDCPVCALELMMIGGAGRTPTAVTVSSHRPGKHRQSTGHLSSDEVNPVDVFNSKAQENARLGATVLMLVGLGMPIGAAVLISGRTQPAGRAAPRAATTISSPGPDQGHPVAHR